MPVIKRYPNRKLYDTEAKQYVTLDQIASLIRKGREVTVIDNATGDDLTSLTLTQIILEQEKKQSGFLPHNLLSGLIQAGGDTLTALQRTLASTIGISHHVDEEIRRRLRLLIDHGELAAEEGRRLLERMVAPDMHLPDEAGEAGTESLSAEAMERYLQDQQIPTRQDLQRLIDQIDDLSARLDEKGEEANQ